MRSSEFHYNSTPNVSVAQIGTPTYQTWRLYQSSKHNDPIKVDRHETCLLQHLSIDRGLMYPTLLRYEKYAPSAKNAARARWRAETSYGLRMMAHNCLHSALGHDHVVLRYSLLAISLFHFWGGGDCVAGYVFVGTTHVSTLALELIYWNILSQCAHSDMETLAHPTSHEISKTQRERHVTCSILPVKEDQNRAEEAYETESNPIDHNR